MARPQIFIQWSPYNDPFTDLSAVTWYDLTPHVLRDPAMQGAPIAIKTGKQSELDMVQTGELTFRLYDTTGDLIPGNASGAFGVIKLCRRIRVRVLWDGVYYTLYTGYTDKWKPIYFNSGFTVIDVRCIDLFGLFSQEKVTISLPASSSNSAIIAVLNAIQYPTSNTSLNGIGTIQATSYTRTSALSILQAIAKVEDGTLYIAPNGYVTMNSRYYRINNQALPFAVFSDQLELLYNVTESITATFDDQFLYNRVTGSSAITGNQQVAEDGNSIISYRARELDVGSVPLSDNAVYSLINWRLYNYVNPNVRIDNIVLNGDLDNTLWPIICNSRFDQRIRAITRYAGQPLTKDAWIAGISHVIAKDSWRTTWNLVPAENTNFARVGYARVGIDRVGY